MFSRTARKIALLTIVGLSLTLTSPPAEAKERMTVGQMQKVSGAGCSCCRTGACSGHAAGCLPGDIPLLNPFVDHVPVVATYSCCVVRLLWPTSTCANNVAVTVCTETNYTTAGCTGFISTVTRMQNGCGAGVIGC